MKKLVFAIAVAMIASLFYSPVMASDFTAGGSYRAIAHNEDPGSGEESTYFDQRFRVKFNWAANDNVSATLRGDFAEFMWGDGYRPESGSDTLMVDRAYVTINQGIMTLIVGQQAGSWGLGTLWSDQFSGIQADFDLAPATLKLLYSKESEGGAATTAVLADADPGTPAGNVKTDDGANDDTDIYGISLLFANDTFSGGLSWAGSRNDATDDELDGFSLHASIPFGMITLSGAIDIFDGEDGSGTDYSGTQAHVAADFKVSDQFKFGLTGIWADDADDGDTQKFVVANDSVFKPLDYDGALAWDNGYFGGGIGIMDVAAANAGVTALVGDAEFYVSDAVTLFAKLGYAEPNENNNLDSKVYAVGNVDYAWMEAVTLSAGAGYVKPDYEDSTSDDAVIQYHLRLGVGF